MSENVILFLAIVLGDNLLFSKMLGLELGVVLRREKKMSVIFAALTIALSCGVSALATVLSGTGVGTVVTATLASLLAIAVSVVLFFVLPKKDNTIPTYVTAFALNTALIGIVSAVSSAEKLETSLVMGLAYGVGILFSIALATCLETRIRFAKPPKAMGKTLLFIVAVAIVAMAFTAFEGFEFRHLNINS